MEHCNSEHVSLIVPGRTCEDVSVVICDRMHQSRGSRGMWPVVVSCLSDGSFSSRSNGVVSPTSALLAESRQLAEKVRNCTFLFLWTLVVKVEADPHIWVAPLTSRSWRPVMLEIDIFASSTGELNIITVAETVNLHDSGLCRLHRVREYDW